MRNVFWFYTAPLWFLFSLIAAYCIGVELSYMLEIRDPGFDYWILTPKE